MDRNRSEESESQDLVPRRFRRRSIARTLLALNAVGADELGPGVVDFRRHGVPKTIGPEELADEVRELLGNSTVEHVTVTAEASQSIAAGGGTVQWASEADAPTERRGFDTLSTELGEGSVGDIPIDRTGHLVLILELQFEDSVTGEVLDETGVDCTVEIERERGATTTTWPDLLEDTDLVGVTGPLSGWVQTNDLVRVKLTVSEGIKVSGTVQASLWVTGETAEAVLIETVWLDSLDAGVTSTEMLESGVAYTLRITGNNDIDSDWTYDQGTTDAILWPSAGHSQTDRGAKDWDTVYAVDASFSGASPPEHEDGSMIDLGSGAQHIEPRNGPHSTPTDGHVYLIDVTGEGSTVTVGPVEGGTLSDNNGQYKIEIFRGVL